MKVRELIEALSKMDGDKQVFVTNEWSSWSGEISVDEQSISYWDYDSSEKVYHENVVVVF